MATITKKTAKEKNLEKYPQPSTVCAIQGPLTLNQFLSLVEEVKTELKVKDWRTFKDDIKYIAIPVALVLLARLTPTEQDRVGLRLISTINEEDLYAAWPALLYGSALPAKVATKPLSSWRYIGVMPDGMGPMKVKKDDKTKDPNIVYLVDYETANELRKEEGFNPDKEHLYTPDELAATWANEVAPLLGIEHLKAVVYAQGLRLENDLREEDGCKRRPELNDVWMMDITGYGDIIRLKLAPEEILVNGKAVRRSFFMAGKFYGGSANTVPVGPVAFALSYILGSESAAKVAGRERFLTELVIERSKGARTEGAAAEKNDAHVGFLGIYAGCDGSVMMCNSVSLPEGRGEDGFNEFIEYCIANGKLGIGNEKGDYSLFGDDTMILGMKVYLEDGVWKACSPIVSDKPEKLLPRLVKMYIKDTLACTIRTEPGKAQWAFKAMVFKVTKPSRFAGTGIADWMVTPEVIQSKPMKDLGAPYKPLVMSLVTLLKMYKKSRDFYKYTVGRSYYLQLAMLVLVTIANSRITYMLRVGMPITAYDAKVFMLESPMNIVTSLEKILRYLGDDVHEDGSLAGFSDRWSQFWVILDAVANGMLVVYDEAEDKQEAKDIAEARAKAVPERDRTFGFSTYWSEEAALKAKGAGFTPLWDAAAMVKFGEVALKPEERDLTIAEWRMIILADKVRLLMNKMEQQTHLDPDTRNLVVLGRKNIIQAVGVSFEDAALILGLLGRASKGRITQPWRKEVVMVDDRAVSHGSLANQVSEPVFRRCYPEPSAFSDLLHYAWTLHKRLFRFALDHVAWMDERENNE